MASIIIGLVLGAAAGILNFKILLYMTSRISRMNTRSAGLFAVGGFVLRTAIYVGLLVAAVYVNWINVFGVAGGLVAASFFNLRYRNKIIK